MINRITTMFLSAHGNVEGDVEIWFITAGVELDVPDCWNLK